MATHAIPKKWIPNTKYHRKCSGPLTILDLRSNLVASRSVYVPTTTSNGLYILPSQKSNQEKHIYLHISCPFFHLLVTSHNNNQQMYQSHFQLTKEFVFLSDDFINFFSVLASTCCYIFNKAIILCVCHFIRSFDAMKYVTFPSTLSLSLSLTEEIRKSDRTLCHKNRIVYICKLLVSFIVAVYLLR